MKVHLLSRFEPICTHIEECQQEGLVAKTHRGIEQQYQMHAEVLDT